MTAGSTEFGRRNSRNSRQGNKVQHDTQQAQAFINQSRLQEAEAIYKRLIQQGAGSHVVFGNLGAICIMQGRTQEAATLLKQALAIKPDFPDALANLGIVLKEQGNLNAAVASYRQALDLKPNYPEARNGLGVTLKEQGNLDAAIESYRQALNLKPNYPEALTNLGSTLEQQGNLDAAAAAYRQALELKPNDPDALSNLATVLTEQGQLEAAVHSCKKALAIKPDFPDALSNLAVALRDQGQLEAAVEFHRKAISLDPDYALGHLNFSLTLLLAGNYDDGWKEYKWRFAAEKICPHALPKLEEWDGNNHTPGEQLTVISEQGMGDTLQFMRYIPYLKTMGVHACFCAQPNLRALIQTSGITTTLYDFKEANALTAGKWIPLLSLPAHLNVKPDNPVTNKPYIKAAEQQILHWKQKLALEKRPIIGINWQGSQLGTKLAKSLPLATFAPILEKTDASLLSLQKGDGSEQMVDCPFRHRFVACQEEINQTWDFLETAAIVANCDLIITNDTALAHLAGGMGQPTWLLLKTVPDWLWGTEGDTTFWYPSMRLFRQREWGNWAEVMERVVEALKARPTKEVEPLIPAKTTSPNSRKANRGIHHARIRRAQYKKSEQKALAFINQGKLQEAEAIYKRLIQQGAGSHVVFGNLGAICVMQGRHQEAATFLKQALAIKPDFSDALGNLGIALKNQGDLDAAVASYRKALAMKPDFPDALANLGDALKEQGNLEAAVASYRKALNLKPNYPEALNSLGVALWEQGNPDAAIASYGKALELKPNYPEVLNGLGVALWEQGNPDAAIASYGKALELKPNYLEALNNLGVAFVEQGDLEAAIAYHRKVVDLDHDNPDYHYNLSYVLLLSGDYQNGLEEYEWRLKQKQVADLPHAYPPVPQWDGQHHLPPGETLMLVSEQGMGDILQFMRYVPYLKTLYPGMDIAFCTKPKLHGLIRSSGIIQRVHTPEEANGFTTGKWLPLVSLLKHLNVRPGQPLVQTPYIKAPAEKVRYWQGRLATEKRPIIGIHWQGNRKSEQILKNSLRLTPLQRSRSLPLEAFAPISMATAATFLSLQKGFGAKQLDHCSFRRRFVACQDEINQIWDFVETAAMVANCDLIITNDTSFAHLAGGMGQPTWLLLNKRSEWRWGMEGEATFWYPAMRLFRQQEWGNWGEVMERVVEALKKTLPTMEAEPFVPAKPALPGQPTHPAGPADDIHHPQHEGEQQALALIHQGQLQAAEAIYKRLIHQGAGSHVVFGNLGAICVMQGRHQEAATFLKQALAIKPDFPDALGNLGIALKNQGDLDAAVAAYRKALAMKPDFPDALANLGDALKEQGNLEAAVASYGQALELKPNYPEALNSLGAVLWEQGNPDAAIASYGKALELKPNYPEVLNSLAVALADQGNLEAAIASHRKAVSLDPENPDYHYNLASFLLLSGDYDNGWQEHEWRNKKKFSALHARPPVPQWNGHHLSLGETLMLISEQGLGDTLQFMRYVPYLKEFYPGMDVAFCAQTKLHDLILCSGITPRVYTPEEAKAFTAGQWLSLFSLAKYLNVSPEKPLVQMPYIKAPAEKVHHWQERLATEKRPIIGIHWQGNRQSEKICDNQQRLIPPWRSRSLPLEAFAPISAATTATFLSLQKNPGAAELDHCSFRHRFVACQDEISQTWDFLETAAMVANCDLIITNDTALAHLAGGMGQPTWLLLKKVPDWRWGMEGDTTFWYPSMRLFRQREWGNWGEVMERVVEALKALPIQEAEPLVPAKPVPLPPGPAEPTPKQVDDGIHHAQHKEDKQKEDKQQALAFINQGRLQEAEAIYKRLIQQGAGNHLVFGNLGAICTMQGRTQEAATFLKQALAIKPDFPDALSNLGAVLTEQDQLEAAVDSCKQALAIKPDFPDALSNLAVALRDQGQLEAAVEFHRKAISLHPDYALGHLNFSLTLLLAGNYGDGWKEYRWRFLGSTANVGPHACPNLAQWDGSNHTLGEQLTIISEQGLGDTLQFMRYIPYLKTMGVDACFCAQPNLHGLIRTSGITATLYDFAEANALTTGKWIPLLSLPAYLNVKPDNPLTNKPYIKAAEQQTLHWQQKLTTECRPIIGINWQASKTGAKARSLPLEAFAPVARVTQASLLSLQKGFGSEQLMNCSFRHHFVACQEEINQTWDFLETAAIMANCDLIITVDTVVAHLAAGLGKPTWLLLKKVPDWRWGMDGDTTFWYSSMRLFRQRERGNWAEVMERVVGALKARPAKTAKPLVPAKATSPNSGKADGGIYRAGVHHAGVHHAQYKEDEQRALALIHQGQPQEAETIYRMLVRKGVRSHAVFGNLGAICTMQGRSQEAITFFREALAIQPDFPDALSNLSQALKEQGQLDAAVDACQKAIAIQPNHSGALYNLGTALAEQGQPDAAIDAYRKALAIKPDFLEALNNLSIVLKEQGQLDAAIDACRQALAIKPDYPDALSNLAVVFWEKGDLQAAVDSCRKALAIKPDYPDALINMGIALRDQGLQDAAIDAYQKVLAIKPDHPDALFNLGNILKDQEDRLADAIKAYHKALAIRPNHCKALSNLAGILRDQDDLQAAIALNKKAVSFENSDPDCRYNLSYSLLLSGDYDKGWEEYEWRLKKKDITFHAHPPVPQWNGRNHSPGETLILVSEQGLGDILQFMRYVPYVKTLGLGLDVAFCVESKLHDLILCSGISTRVHTPEDASGFTAGKWLYLLSLPRLLKVSPAQPLVQTPYIKAPAEKIHHWQEKLAAEQRPIIGIHWQGNRQRISLRSQQLTPLWRSRSLSLEAFAPISAATSATFLSLQKGAGAEQLDHCSFRHRFVACQDEINKIWDFVETAAMIANCDLIITNDTALAHLAGGMGQPTWLLLNKRAEWRWGMDGETTFWYPSMRLFRQREWGDWAKVMERVVEALKAQPTREAEPLVPTETTSPTPRQAKPLPRQAESTLGKTDGAIHHAGIHHVQHREEEQRALAFIHQGQQQEAAAIYRKLIRQGVRSHVVFGNLGVICTMAGKTQEAITFFREALAIKPDFPDALANLGVALKDQGDLDAAVASFGKALALKPDYPQALFNLGVTFWEQGNLDAAIASYRKALDLNPNYQEVWNNLGIAFAEQGDLDAAIASYRKASSLDHENPEYHCNLSYMLLSSGDYDNGWEEHGWRLKNKDTRLHAHPSASPWNGHNLAPEETLLLVSEQGLGDTLQFMRYVPYLKEFYPGMDVAFCAQPKLHGLILSSGIITRIHTSEEANAFTAGKWLPLLSLPRHLKVNPEQPLVQTPYIKVPAEKVHHWQEKLATEKRPIIGIHWQGKRKSERTHEGGQRLLPLWRSRSLPLEAFAPLSAATAATFLSLQKGDGVEQLHHCSFRHRFVACQDDINQIWDFVDTAALVANCDLIITNDTSLAHLAGGMGQPTWLLLKKSPDWRWGAAGDATFWYPSMRLFRQREWGNWAEVMERVAEALKTQPHKKPLKALPIKETESFVPANLAAPTPGQAGGLNPAQQEDKQQALAFMKQGRIQEAEAIYRRLIQQGVRSHVVFGNLGAACIMQGRSQEATTFLREALAIQPDYPDALSNLGIALQEQDQLEAAIDAYKKAVAVKPDFRDALSNLGFALTKEGQLEAAIEFHRKAISLDPDYTLGHINLSHTLLLSGNYEDGWKEHEWRLKLKKQDMTPVHAHPLIPRWDGHNLAPEETLLLISEGGLGDTLHFMRYVPYLKTLNPDMDIAFCAQPKLHDLILCSGISSRVHTSEQANAFTTGKWMPLLSLPGHLKVSPEQPLVQTPYIKAPAEKIHRWQEKLTAEKRPVIGIHWQGNKQWKLAHDQAHDKLNSSFASRSIPLEAFAPISTATAATFLSLQKGDGAEELHHCSFRHRFVACQDAINGVWDFVETAAMIANCDLIITNDTSLAHLAGGMGQPTWLLLNKRSEWRWGNEGEATFWYPSMRLFRQREWGNWTEVMEHVVEALKAPPSREAESLVSAKPASPSPGQADDTHYAQPKDDEQRALALINQGQPQEAEIIYRKLIQQGVRSHLVFGNLGAVCIMQDKNQEAVTFLKEALAIKPDFADALANLGIAFKNHGDPDAAVASCRQVLDLKPNDPKALTNLGDALKEQGDLDAAVASYRQALALQPNDLGVLNSLGLAFKEQNNLEAAIASYGQALDIQPNHPGVLNNLGLALVDQGDLEAAIVYNKKAASLDHENPEYHYGLASVLLLSGDYDNGWEEYEWRLKRKPVTPFHVHPPVPQWNGHHLSPEETLMLVSEQGLGDTLQFMRYVPYLKTFCPGMDVAFCAQPNLHDLILCSGISTRVHTPEEAGTFTAGKWLPLLSLPRYLKVSPAQPLVQTPYIQAPAEKVHHWQGRLATEQRPIIGIYWQGRTQQELIHGNPQRPVPLWKRRSLPLGAFAPISAATAATFLSLQKGDGAEQLDHCSFRHRFVACQDDINGIWDFVETAAMVANCDLIITNDSALAHLAGGMGQPTWLLLKKSPDWRWGTEGDTTFWYRSMRLFRQREWGNWAEVMERVVEALKTPPIRKTEPFVPAKSASLPPEPAEPTPGQADDVHHPQHQEEQQRALAFIHQGQLQKAEAVYRKLIQQGIRSHLVFGNLGAVCIKQGRGQEAITFLKEALAIQPDFPDALANLGYVSQQRGNFQDAIDFCRQALAIKSNNPEALCTLGNALQKQGDLNAAIDTYRKALVFKPDYCDALFNLGDTLQQHGDLDAAIDAYRKVLAMKPNAPGTLNNLGSVLGKQGNLEAAIDSYQKALALKPNYPEALSNLGNVFKIQGRLDAAIDTCQKALAIKPDFPDARLNLGHALVEQGDLEAAIASYRKAIALDHENPLYHSNLSHALLSSGDYGNGWKEHEWRLKKKHVAAIHHAHPPTPQWNGHHLFLEETLMLVSEQGLGDTLQFMRYVPYLKTFCPGMDVAFCAQPKLHDLILCSGITPRVHTPEEANVFTAGKWLPLLSLPGHLKVSPSQPLVQTPYIKVPAEKVHHWQARLANEKRPIIAIHWQGNRQSELIHGNAQGLVPLWRSRSLPLETFAPISAATSATFLSLQKGGGAEQLDHCSFRHRFVTCQDEINRIWDFVETAAIIANCDLIITNDTALTHLAGGMGQPTWLLLKKSPDWRWGMDGETTFWYPSMRLFRQREWGNWVAVMERVVEALKAPPTREAEPLAPPKPAEPTPRQADDISRAQHKEEEQRALALINQGQPQEAEAIYRRLIQQGVRSHRVFGNLGAVCIMQGRSEEAITFLREALAIKPDFPDALANLGIALKNQGDLDAAVASCRQVLDLKPNDPEALANLGDALRKQGDLDAAVASYRQALDLKPNDPEALFNLGITLGEQGNLDAAIASYRNVLDLKPNHPETLNNLGAALGEQGNLDAAAVYCRQALDLKPDDPETLSNLGSILGEQGDPDAAVTCYGKALDHRPNHPGTLNNLGSAFVKQGNLDAAAVCYRKAISLDHENPEYHYNLSEALLTSGDYDNGWREYEWRFKRKHGAAAWLHGHPPVPQWNGHHLPPEETLMLVSEQGLGDALQFMRYVPYLKTFCPGMDVAFCAQPKLHGLILSSGIIPMVHTPAQAHTFTAGKWLPLLSLPRHLKVSPTQPLVQTPYIKAPAEKIQHWQEKLATEQRPIIGIHWQGNRYLERTRTPHGNRLRPTPLWKSRSLPLEAFAPISAATSASFLSLQKGDGTEQLDHCPFRHRFVACQDEINQIWDFVEAAAMIANCDLIITNDTALAHLAGGMGQPTWLLLNKRSEWRWGMDGDTTFWYPSMRLFRQREWGNWVAVMERVVEALKTPPTREAEPFVPAKPASLPPEPTKPTSGQADNIHHSQHKEEEQRALAFINQGQRQEAEAIYRKLIQQGVRSHIVFGNLGAVCIMQGRGQEAVTFLKEALVVKPDFPDALANLGYVSHQRGDFQEAIDCCKKALAIKSNNPEALCTLGSAIQKQGDLKTAIDTYKKALVFKPDYCDALINLGGALQKQGDLDAAIDAYEKALALKPNAPGIFNNLGTALGKKGDLDAAVDAYQKALALKPEYPAVLSNLGNVLRKQGRLEAAIDACQKALAMKPDFPDALSNLGNTFKDQGNMEAAIASYRKGLALRPDSKKLLLNLAFALPETGDLQAAVELARKAVSLDKDYALGHLILAIWLLLSGDYNEGWKEYRWRFEAKKINPHALPKLEEWNGNNHAPGEQLTVISEQGLGDTLQFMRYIPHVKAMGMDVCFCAQPKLHGLIQASGITTSLCDPDTANGLTTGKWVSLLSLPAYLKVSPDNPLTDTAYLKAPAPQVLHWKQKLALEHGPVIGLNWQGNPQAENGHLEGRSLPLAALAPLPQTTAASFLSLQKGHGSQQLMDCSFKHRFVGCQEEINQTWDFLETAAILANCDLIITVDTAVAHLAAGLGRPTWLLLKRVPDWRWGMEGESSFWYRSMRLFRQRERGNWTEVVQRVARALEALPGNPG